MKLPAVLDYSLVSTGSRMVDVIVHVYAALVWASASGAVVVAVVAARARSSELG